MRNPTLNPKLSNQLKVDFEEEEHAIAYSVWEKAGTEGQTSVHIEFVFMIIGKAICWILFSKFCAR